MKNSEPRPTPGEQAPKPDDDAPTGLASRARQSTARMPSEKAYEALKGEILDGEMAAGDRLVEESTAKRLGMSRTPVREALLRLESERLVTRDGRGAAVVAGLSPVEIEDVYAARSVLEGLSARLAAGNMLPRDHARLSHVQTLLEDATVAKRFDQLGDLNLQFHDVILRSTRNATVINFMAQIHDTLRRAKPTTMAYPGRAAAAMKEHRDLMAALKSGNARQAEKIARQHIDSALDVRLLMHLKEEFSESS